MGFQIGFPALRNYPPSGVTYDVDAQAMFDARALVGDEPTAPYKQAISDYVTAIKAVSGLWDDIIQLVVIAGATTVAGASKSIKGLDLINNNFVDADIDLKTGSIGDASTKYWATGYSGLVSGTAQDDFHIYGYFTEIGTGAFFGNGGGGVGPFHLQHNLSRCRTNASNGHSSTTAGSHGLNRTSSANFELVINNAAPTTVARTSGGVDATAYLLLARSDTGDTVSFRANHRALVYAMGAGITTLADYQTPTDDLITALNAI